MNDTAKNSIPGLKTLPEPGFDFLFGLSLEVSRPTSLGHTPAGERRVIGVEGGMFSGPYLEGRVLPGGSDWIVVRDDGVLIQDVRITLQTYDEHTLLMSYRGMRHGPEDTLQRLDRGEDMDPSEYYFRTVPVFEAPEGRYEWLNKLMAFGVGRRQPEGVIYSVYALS